MKLKIKPHHKNDYPLRGVLIKNPSPIYWLQQIQYMQLSLDKLECYPLPGKVPNSVWGCLIVPFSDLSTTYTSHPSCQVIDHRIFIPCYATLFPRLSKKELSRLFPRGKYLVHPDIGCVLLEEALEWSEMLDLGEPGPLTVNRPSKAVFIPEEVKSLIVKETPPEKVLKKLEEQTFPEKKKFDDKPLSMLEKVKLQLLKLFFKDRKRPSNNKEGSENTSFSWLNRWKDRLEKDYKELEKRNKKALDKLMSMFKENPDEALKYAIPLDADNTSRGFDTKSPDFTKRWFDFSAWLEQSGSGGAGGGTAVIAGEQFNQLRNQYRNTAERLIERGDYKKAAFVYLKLLKDSLSAARTLEEGHYYAEAASLYLKYLQNKEMAASCYEKGNLITQAIDLHTEMGHYEKAGDLYTKINRNEEAAKFYGMVVDDQREKKKYIKASELLRTKLGDEDEAQKLLKKGWIERVEAFDCLDQYLENIQEDAAVLREMEDMYINHTDHNNMPLFLRAVISEYKRKRKTRDGTRTMAYEIIAKEIHKHPDMGSYLTALNPEDRMITKDFKRFRTKRSK